MKKRDYNIEIARVIACFIVVSCHVLYGVYLGHSGVKLSAFFRCVLSDGVAVFWMITGCFIFNKEYKVLLISILKSVVLPMTFFGLLFFYFWRVFSEGLPLVESMYHSPRDYLEVFLGVLTFSNKVDGFGQAWYLWAYIFIAIFFIPVLKPFVHIVDSNTKVRNMFLIVSAVLLIVNDVTLNNLLELNHQVLKASITGALFMVWGHIFYRNKKYFQKRIFVFISIISFVVLNVVRAMLLVFTSEKFMDDNWIHWYTIFGLLSSTIILVFTVSLRNVGDVFGKVITFVGRNTFFIYILHGIPLVLISRYMIDEYLYNIITISNDNLRFVLLLLVNSILVFIWAFIIAIFFNATIMLVKKIVKKSGD